MDETEQVAVGLKTAFIIFLCATVLFVVGSKSAAIVLVMGGNVIVLIISYKIRLLKVVNKKRRNGA